MRPLKTIKEIAKQFRFIKYFYNVLIWEIMIGNDVRDELLIFNFIFLIRNITRVNN